MVTLVLSCYCVPQICYRHCQAYGFRHEVNMTLEDKNLMVAKMALGHGILRPEVLAKSKS